MIVGIGTDLIEIQRVKRACLKEAFLTRCFTEKEIKMFANDFTKAAGNFAVKEAVSKVFGTGIRNYKLTDIEVLRDEYGKPFVILNNNAKLLADGLGITAMHVSITNTKEYAQAFAIGESVK